MAAPAAPLEPNTFELILSESRGRPIRVKAKFNESSIRCESASGKVVEIQRDEVEHVDMTHLNKFHQLRFTLNDGSTRNLNGFKRAQLDEVRRLVQEAFGREAALVETSSKGWNWGMLQLADRSLDFRVDQKIGFELPLSAIADARDAGRNQVTVEIQQDENARPDDDCITDIRFFIPNADPDLVESIRQRAKVGLNASDSVASFDTMNFIVPRGRFDVEIHPALIKLKGMSASYNILHKNISQLYLLQRPDGHRVFVMHVEPPLRAGNTPHSFLLIQIKDEDMSEVELNLSDEKLAEYDKLSKRMEGLTAEVFGHIVRAISGKPVFQTGSFRNSKGEGSIRCSLKNDLGFLFPLEKRFVYIHKPTTIIRYDEILHVEFARVSAAKKDSKATFDLVVTLKSDDPQLTFTGINRDELNNLLTFVATKKIKVENAEHTLAANSAMVDDDDDDEEEDSDFEAESDGDDDDDASLSGSGVSSSDESDDDNSDDESSKKSKKRKKRDSDSENESASDDEEAKKKKEKKKEKREKRKEKKEKKKKEKKDKNDKKEKEKGPKKPKTAFLFFSGAKRKEVQEANPELDFAGLNRLLGDMWNKLGADERQPFETQAEVERGRYEAEKAQLKAAKREAATASSSSASSSDVPAEPSSSLSSSSSSSADSSMDVSA